MFVNLHFLSHGNALRLSNFNNVTDGKPKASRKLDSTA